MADSFYTIKLSDPKNDGNPILVYDGSVEDTRTALTLVGRNYPAYGQILETDLVHMLENFSAPTAPLVNIEGQTWYDSVNQKLKVFNGTIYIPVGGTYQTTEEPLNASIGDIWVDTSNNQLKIFNGTDFTLVGPNYSGALKSGSYATTSDDIYGNTHRIVVNYVDDNAIAIISQDTFTPAQVIEGFSSLHAGVNLTNKNLGSLSSPTYATFFGTSYQAEALLQTYPVTERVSANNFVRNDINQKLNGILTLRDGLKVGQDARFSITRDGESGSQVTLLNAYDSGTFSIQIAKNNDNKKIVTVKGDSQRVGINTISPVADLDVNGSVNIATTATVQSLHVTSLVYDMNTSATNAVVVDGGVSIAKTLTVEGEHILVGPLTIGRTTGPAAGESSNAFIPQKTQAYSIGSETFKWHYVYADNFYGNLTGIATKASQLAGTSTFVALGDVASSYSWNGVATPSLTYVTTLTKSAIYGRTSTSTTVATDSVVIYRPQNALTDNQAVGNGALYKQSRKDFLWDLYAATAFTGAVVASARNISSQAVTDAPPNSLSSNKAVGQLDWLLCDGTLYDGSPASPYYNLFLAIGQTYGGSGTQFAVPDLRNHLGPNNPGYVGFLNYYIKT